MLETICGAIFPVVLSMMLGYLGAYLGMFNRDQATAINRMVLKFALPMDLFVGIARINRDQILNSGRFASIIIAWMILSFLLTYWFSRFVFKRSVSLAALQAMAVGNPSVPFVGSAVLGFLFGGQSALAVSLASLTINVVLIPILYFLLASDNPETMGQSDNWMSHLVQAGKQPVVLAPLAAFVWVLSGFHIPHLLTTSFVMLGKTTGGAAMFAAGILLCLMKPVLNSMVLTSVTIRNIIAPVVAWGLAIAAHLSPFYLREVVLTFAMPSASVIVMLSSQIKKGEREAASTVFFSTVASVFTMGALIALTAE
ncbi:MULTISPECIES: AEC family transporter [Acetobacter]|uniref:AEC family transporter n=1 Tax=Acetobacter thailandicus TaxID=1502842 RepID=A0ABT3QC01_9PROT|nr:MULTISPECIES: AEC family transporter [Acetobacter]MBS0959004.1 AEC family transporter [Acetobacter thailandicus]MBS0980358.1 AEC family transporter [Acetobacter thailandicus]MBS0985109.1 AEC family transporter [Acetobacter thailandicus]MBS1003352.1 AEC family transporter [Acetobacter thailandicus]MCX2562813.1 AEC family transporter [Acetobacter thailandicus]